MDQQNNAKSRLEQVNAVLQQSDLTPASVDLDVQHAYAGGNASVSDLLAHAQQVAKELTGQQK